MEAEVRALLAAHEAAGGFMADDEPPSPEVAEDKGTDHLYTLWASC